jgi:uncharacterized protein YukE
VGSGAKSPAKLASFAYDWVGGDIHGLSAYAGTLYGYVPEISDVVTALDKKVGQIVGDAGWTGSAASAFTKNWEHDAAGANALGVVITSAGDIVDQLAVDLAKIENALEQAADLTTAHGVPVGADGKGPQVCYADQTKEQWRLGYESFWQQCIQAAQQARVQAAGALQKVYGEIAPPAPGQQGVTPSDANTLSDYLRGFWALPTEYSKFVRNQIPGLRSEVAQAKALWIAARDARPSPRESMPADVKQALHDARGELSSAQRDLQLARNNENVVSKVLGVRLSDLPGLGNVADGLGQAGFLGKLAKFGLDFPVIDVAAAGVSTVLNAQDDMSKGIPWYEAYPGEAASNIGGIAAGIGAGSLVTTGVAAGATALGIAGAPVIGVAAGVAVGGVVAIGVGDFGHNLIQENWGADWQQHGAVMGTLDGIGDSAVKTGQDMGHMATDIWHGITSIF